MSRVLVISAPGRRDSNRQWIFVLAMISIAWARSRMDGGRSPVHALRFIRANGAGSRVARGTSHSGQYDHGHKILQTPHEHCLFPDRMSRARLQIYRKT